MRRRDFIVGLGSVAAEPMLAHAQQGVRRVGVLAGGAEDTATLPKNLRDGLQKLGWIEGRNLKLDVRYGGGDANLYRAYAAELVSLNPDVIVTSGQAGTKAVQQQTQTIPIVFVAVDDPVAAGIVKSLARPEGNATGMTNGFSLIGGKWVQLLKEAVPRIERVAAFYDPSLQLEDSFLTSIEAVARSLGLQAIRIPDRNAVELERAIEAFAAEPNGGLIVRVSTQPFLSLPRFFGLMVKHRLPAIYQNSLNAADGGLMSYGANVEEYYRRRASHVDRILRGAKPGDLPVEYSTKFDLVINLKTAKAIGITFPPSLIALADKVIE
jgi:putative tryptophan/tyrosine transport system substrate-binding protein